MSPKSSYIQLFICYILWGFQPLYWNLCEDIDSFTLISMRTILVAVYTLILLATKNRIGEVKAVIKDRAQMKFLAPSTVFLAGDWIVFILAVRSGHVLDTSLGYYIVPLVVFIFGVFIYKERINNFILIAFLTAVVGVLVNAISFGKIPLLSIVVALIWSSYITVKKNVQLDGMVSIAIEASILSIVSIIFLALYRRAEAVYIFKNYPLFILGSGLITGFPLYLYSNAIPKIPMITLGFCQYLSPTFNILCGFIMGERFSNDQLTSLCFFILSIIIFSVSEIKKTKES